MYTLESYVQLPFLLKRQIFSFHDLPVESDNFHFEKQKKNLKNNRIRGHFSLERKLRLQTQNKTKRKTSNDDIHNAQATELPDLGFRKDSFNHHSFLK